ncbi:hypothetical protein ACKF11_13095 [Methylobacillus sp. Pita2]|uniref:hypothetical protein n=1 Tax=Methylobacillus sp. Pita2 TaxID=3383245 RepID=UPI0038B6322E
METPFEQTLLEDGIARCEPAVVAKAIDMGAKVNAKVSSDCKAFQGHAGEMATSLVSKRPNNLIPALTSLLYRQAHPLPERIAVARLMLDAGASLFPEGNTQSAPGVQLFLLSSNAVNHITQWSNPKDFNWDGEDLEFRRSMLALLWEQKQDLHKIFPSNYFGYYLKQAPFHAFILSRILDVIPDGPRKAWFSLPMRTNVGPFDCILSTLKRDFNGDPYWLTEFLDCFPSLITLGAEYKDPKGQALTEAILKINIPQHHKENTIRAILATIASLDHKQDATAGGSPRRRM